MTIEFSALHLIIGNKSPSLKLLEKVFNKHEELYTYENSHYLISTSTIDNNLFWFHAQYGNSLPYNDTVYNIGNHTKENNPRTPNQVETVKQLFGMYDLKNKVLYLSNFIKKPIFESFLNSLLNEEVVIKAFIIDADDFCEKIKTIDSIKFVAKKDLFSISGSVFSILPNPKDLFGLGMPEKFTLSANFSKKNKTTQFIYEFKKLVGWKKNVKLNL